MKQNNLFDEKEEKIAEYLRKLGRKVEPNELEGVSGMGRQGDAFVDGIKTEFKTLKADSKASAIKNDVNKSIKYGGQARNLIIDLRNTEISREEAEQAVFRALGISRGKIDKIEIIGKDYFLGYTPKENS